MKKVNALRLRDGIRSGQIRKDESERYAFTSSSFDANVLAENPNFELGYFIAPPRMNVRIRVYKTIDSEKYYSKWSAPLEKKVK